MPRLLISTLLDFDLDELNTESYTIDELVELCRLTIQYEQEEFGLEVSVRDYMVQE